MSANIEPRSSSSRMAHDLITQSVAPLWRNAPMARVPPQLPPAPPFPPKRIQSPVMLTNQNSTIQTFQQSLRCYPAPTASPTVTKISTRKPPPLRVKQSSNENDDDGPGGVGANRCFVTNLDNAQQQTSPFYLDYLDWNASINNGDLINTVNVGPGAFDHSRFMNMFRTQNRPPQALIGHPPASGTRSTISYNSADTSLPYNVNEPIIIDNNRAKGARNTTESSRKYSRTNNLIKPTTAGKGKTLTISSRL